MMHNSNIRPGRQAAVLSIKNDVHPRVSASAPPDADNIVRPTAANDDNIPHAPERLVSPGPENKRAC